MTKKIDDIAIAVAKLLDINYNPDAKFLNRRNDMLRYDGIYPSGKKFRIHTTINGHKVLKGGFKTKQAAAEFVLRLRNDQDALSKYVLGKHHDGSAMSVGEALEAYCRPLADRRTVSAVRHLTRLLGASRVIAIRQDDISRYIKARIADGAALCTVGYELGLLRSAHRSLWMSDRLPDLPRWKCNRDPGARTRVLSEDEINRLIDNTHQDLSLLIRVAFVSGMRSSELISAQSEWLNRETGELTLPAKTTKTKRARVVTLPMELVAMLPYTEGYLLRRNGKPWTRQTKHIDFRAACEDLGLTNVRFHDLRRSMASHSMRMGHSIRAIQASGGWADPSILLKHYTHASINEQSAVASDLMTICSQKVPQSASFCDRNNNVVFVDQTSSVSRGVN